MAGDTTNQSSDMSQTVNNSGAPPIPQGGIFGKGSNSAVNQMAKDLVEQKRHTE